MLVSLPKNTLQLCCADAECHHVWSCCLRLQRCEIFMVQYPSQETVRRHTALFYNYDNNNNDNNIVVIDAVVVFVVVK